MKRSFSNQILAASIVAACVSCSRNSHLYSIGEVGNTYEHQWVAFHGSCGVFQIRVPYDASGMEVRHLEQMVAHSRTYTYIFIPRHHFEFRGPAWLIGVLASSILAAISAASLHVASRIRERNAHENDPA